MEISTTPKPARKTKDDYIERLERLVHSGRVGFIRQRLLNGSTKEERLKTLEDIGVCLFCGTDLLVFDANDSHKFVRSVCTCAGSRMYRAVQAKRKSDG